MAISRTVSINLIIIYCYVIIFGSWCLNSIHFPPQLGLALLQLVDVIPFILFFATFKLRSSNDGLPNTLNFWLLVFLFLILSVFNTLNHQGSIGASTGHFGAMFRYVPLAAIISTAKLCNLNKSKLYIHFVYISVILCSIGFLEIIGGQSVSYLFRPLKMDPYDSNAVFDFDSLVSTDISGIFPNAIDYSYFLLISYCIISNRKHLRYKFILFVAYVVLIYFSGSKSALIIFVLCVFSQFKSQSIKACFIGCVITGSVILMIEFWDLFIWTVFIDSRSSRLGLLIDTLPSFLSEMSYDTWFGASPDRVLTYHKINSYPNPPVFIWDVDHMTSFEDEFYVALPVYYGVIGFSIILYLYSHMLNTLLKAKFKNSDFDFHTIIKCLCIILIIAPLFNQIIITKPFSLFFWVWIGLFCNPSNIEYKSKICTAI